MSESEQKWRFGVVGNIVGKHVGDDGNIYYGTKAFTPGTKVYIDGRFWDETQLDVSVIGLNRFGHMVLGTIPLKLIENVRSQRIYEPSVLSLLDHLAAMDGWEWWGTTAADRKATECFAKQVNALRHSADNPQTTLRHGE